MFETSLVVLKLKNSMRLSCAAIPYCGMVTARNDDVVRPSRLATPAQSLLARLRRARLEIHRRECAFIPQSSRTVPRSVSRRFSTSTSLARVANSALFAPRPRRLPQPWHAFLCSPCEAPTELRFE